MRKIDLIRDVCFLQEGLILLRSEVQLGLAFYQKEGSMSRTEEIPLKSLKWKEQGLDEARVDTSKELGIEKSQFSPGCEGT
jgi:hypothetical protein